jgi:D-alanyl-lipoteichoic acid acyltransferase DltB (MBOAT superfamily)
MIIGSSSFTLLVFFCVLVAFNAVQGNRTLRLLLLCGFNLGFLLSHGWESAVVVGFIGLAPYALLRFRPGMSRVATSLLAPLAIGLFVYFKLRIEPAKAGVESFDALFRTSLPLGYSFVMYLSLSLLFDWRRHSDLKTPGFLEYCATAFFAPAIPAGPFVKFREIGKSDFAAPSTTGFLSGLILVFWGLSKKSFADFVGMSYLAGDAFLASQSPLESWTLAVLVPVRFYCDFSGSTDLAIGMGRTFGIHLPSNFNLPFLARSVTDYWRRWHISLGEWYREYFYTPLIFKAWPRLQSYGVNPVVFNAGAIFLTMMLIALWHGLRVHFLIWAAYVTFTLAISPVLERIGRRPRFGAILAAGMTFYLMMWGQIILIHASLMKVISKWVAMHAGIFAGAGILKFEGREFLLPFTLIMLIVPHLVDRAFLKLDDFGWARMSACLTITMMVYFLLGRMSLPFIYSRF